MTVNLILANGTKVSRSVRRIVKHDGFETGWTTIAGKAVKVFRHKFKKNWTVS